MAENGFSVTARKTNTMFVQARFSVLGVRGWRNPNDRKVDLSAQSQRRGQGVQEGRFREDLFYRLSFFPLPSRRCANGARTFRSWSGPLSKTSPGRWAVPALTLPNTKLTLYVPLVTYYMAVRGKGREQSRRRSLHYSWLPATAGPRQRETRCGRNAALARTAACAPAGKATRRAERIIILFVWAAPAPSLQQ